MYSGSIRSPTGSDGGGGGAAVTVVVDSVIGVDVTVEVWVAAVVSVVPIAAGEVDTTTSVSVTGGTTIALVAVLFTASWIELVETELVVVSAALVVVARVDATDEEETSLRTAATVSTSMATTSDEPLDPHALRLPTTISQCHFTRSG